jgi:hypothetical protein
MMKRTRLMLAGATGVVLLALTLGACDSTAPTSQAQNDNQSLSNQIEEAARHAVPYPKDQMIAGGWTEEQMLKEHLLRENDPNATRWVIWLGQQGQVIAQWPIKGMVFDPNSSMTETTDVVCNSGGASNGGYACGTVNSPGDNGTYGPEAGAAAFFTTSNVEIQLPPMAIWVESDAPLNITTQPVITYNVNQAPSVNHGGLTNIGSGH